jgi:hypothetical protein
MTENESPGAEVLRVTTAFTVSAAPPGVMKAVAARLDLRGLVDQIVVECATVAFPKHRHDAEFLDLLRASVHQNARGLRDVLVGDTDLADVGLDRVLSFAHAQARLRIPQTSMQRSYRISFSLLWQAWTDAVERVVLEEQLGPQVALTTVRHVTNTVLRYQDHAASRVAETHTRDLDALNRSRTHIRQGLVRDILRGEEDRLTASDLALLGHPLEGHHVAVLLPRTAEEVAARLAESLRTAIAAHRSLVHPVTLTSTVLWLTRMDPWSVGSLAELSRQLVAADVEASFSAEHAGAAGLRVTFQEARAVEQVRSAWESSGVARTVVGHDDAGLEILLLENPDLARAFLRSELGPLADETAEARRLRDTLEASFRLGSHVAAAEHLGLHEHTVRNRLARVEQLLGHPATERRTELQVAVRLLRVLSGETEPDAAEGTATDP